MFTGPAQFIHGSTTMLDHQVGETAIPAGSVVVVGDETRIAHVDLPANELGALAAPTGNAVYDVPKDESAEFEAGQPLYWDDVADEAVADPGVTVLKAIGFAVHDAGAGTTKVRVRHTWFGPDAAWAGVS